VTIQSLGTELERSKAAAREQSHELAQLDEEPSQAARALEAERVEAASRMDEQLRALGLQVARLNEQVLASDADAQSDAVGQCRLTL